MITEEEAKSIAIKETDYCYVIAQAWEAEPFNSICLERIFTKGGCEEIRMAWWKNGRQTMRPADIDAPGWGRLFSEALKEGVFLDSEKFGMLKSLLS
ncbi:hypothetical protein [Microbulbifer marinus]|uniref:Uncharacterized protein n=1 Tax=Microbulbifer marinus TaxID=658218 RepID=A0A1H3Z9P3_9GAMM|nr:hypothetical protein [Microbulbifer marinus]SEA20456.1 hypothetical protein SAMN05216562_2275 [Microbulbifer marinus]